MLKWVPLVKDIYIIVESILVLTYFIELTQRSLCLFISFAFLRSCKARYCKTFSVSRGNVQLHLIFAARLLFTYYL